MIVGHIGGSSSGGYEIQKSLRFRASASAYLSRTPSVAGNRQTWTWSGWVKRGKLGANATLLWTQPSGAMQLDFTAADQLELYQYNAGYQLQLVTNRVFRDPSAWYHILCIYDSTNATTANRIRFYINGVQETSFATANYPTANYSGYLNGASLHGTGGSATYFDGYLSEINFIDGQALDPSYFGQVSAETGSWIPKKYSGTYGTNGFYLPFDDGSTLGNLTADRSGNGNNWTANNFSLTPGVTYDWMDDTPTNNFAVLNPLDGGLGKPSMTNGNLTAISSAGGSWPEGAYSTVAMPPGKWYCEISPESGADLSGIMIGVIKADRTDSRWYYNATGNRYAGTVNGGAYGAAYTNGNIIGVAYDSIAGVLSFYRDGVSQGVAYNSMQGDWLFGVCDASSGANLVRANANFGQRPFAYSPPAGFKALCTKNLPIPSILNPKKHFDVTTYTGTGAVRSITGLGFTPDLVWMKSRGSAQQHMLQDSVRGATRFLSSNLTTAEALNVNTLTSFDSGGFTLGSEPAVNQSATAFAGWNWKAGGAPVTNNAGSIQSQVSANPQAGFSIVTGTMANGGGSFGHGLGAAPGLVIAKRRGVVDNWFVWNKSLSNPQQSYLVLSGTAAQTTNVSIWNGSAPTSLVFSLGGGFGANGDTFVAYCFAEIPGYSKIGSYTGNGSADGPFVYCGFRPRFVMIKNASDGTATWIMWDSARDTYNVERNQLYPNQAAAEVVDAANNTLDFLSNGFKFRGASTVGNGSGNTIIFIAFAEAPFKFANAR